MPEKLGDAPIDAAYRKKMQELARFLDITFNGKSIGTHRPTGFVLMVFPFTGEGKGTDGRCNYISNGANREDVVVLMKEMIARFEGQPEIKGHA